jgi:elongation of very long chain fatty acids protein 6
MNYFVHAIMYFYYFLMAIKRKPKWFNPMWITCMQIGQMVVGVLKAVCGVYIILIVQPTDCGVMNAGNVGTSAVAYAAFFVLFTKCFLQRYKVRGFGKTKKA